MGSGLAKAEEKEVMKFKELESAFYCLKALWKRKSLQLTIEKLLKY